MERKIPSNLGAQILNPLVGWESEKHTEERYIGKIQAFERKVEKSLIETFKRIDIQGIVKTDPYSLPYKKEIKVTLRGESYLNGPYEIFRVVRPIIKQLLNENLYKIRFYVYIDVDTEGRHQLSMGEINYYFRYNEH
jgi:hypothetical protein